MVRKVLFSVIATLTLTAPAYAGPAIDFTTLAPLATFNSAQNDTATVAGIQIDGFVYTGGTTYVTNKGFLWLRNNSNDRGLGYCSKGESCGATTTTGDGDANELSDENKTEIIRLTRPSGRSWSDIWVSSLDTGGSGSNETGTIYWSNNPIANLASGSVSHTTFSHTSSGFGSSVEGSIFGLLSGFDANANYLFFRAGPNARGTNNDYLVWGAGVAAIPEPEIYAMLAAGLGLMGFAARRRKGQAAAA